MFRSAYVGPSGLIRDLKEHTAKAVVRAIRENQRESGKERLLWMFERAGKKKANASRYRFWRQHNKPIELWGNGGIEQKSDHIHNDPVGPGFVPNPQERKYGSARNFANDHTVLKIDEMGFLGQTCFATSCKLAVAGQFPFRRPSFLLASSAYFTGCTRSNELPRPKVTRYQIGI